MKCFHIEIDQYFDDTIGEKDRRSEWSLVMIVFSQRCRDSVLLSNGLDQISSWKQIVQALCKGISHTSIYCCNCSIKWPWTIYYRLQCPLSQLSTNDALMTTAEGLRIFVIFSHCFFFRSIIVEYHIKMTLNENDNRIWNT